MRFAIGNLSQKIIHHEQSLALKEVRKRTKSDKIRGLTNCVKKIRYQRKRVYDEKIFLCKCIKVDTYSVK